MNAIHSLLEGISKRFPITGRPFGPGGRGQLDILALRFRAVENIRAEMATMITVKSKSLMSHAIFVIFKAEILN